MRRWRGLLEVTLGEAGGSIIAWDYIYLLGADVSYPTYTPATAGVFIYLNIPRSLKNSSEYLAPLPTSTAYLEPLSPPK